MTDDKEIIDEWTEILKEEYRSEEDLADAISNGYDIEFEHARELADKIIKSDDIQYIGANSYNESFYAHKDAKIECESCESGEHECEGYVYNLKCACKDCEEDPKEVTQSR